MKRFKLFLLSLSLLIVTACGGGGGTTYWYGYNAYDFTNRVNSLLGDHEISVTKANAIRDGWIVVYDEAYGYQAVDLEYLKNNYYTSSSAADAYLSNDLYNRGIARDVYPSFGNTFIDDHGYLYEQKTIAAKDLESIEAILEEATVKRVSKYMVDNFGLSKDKSFKVAKASMDWKKISNTRSMTQKDLDELSNDILGIDIASIKKATEEALQGNSQEANALLEKAAQSLDTTPQNLESIITALSE